MDICTVKQTRKNEFVKRLEQGKKSQFAKKRENVGWVRPKLMGERREKTREKLTHLLPTQLF